MTSISSRASNADKMDFKTRPKPVGLNLRCKAGFDVTHAQQPCNGKAAMIAQPASLTLLATRLKLLKPRREVVVIADDVVSVKDFVIVLLHKLIPLVSQLLEGVVLFLDAIVGFLQPGFQFVHGVLVLANFIGERLVLLSSPFD